MLLMYVVVNGRTNCNCRCHGPSRCRIDDGSEEAQHKTNYILNASLCLDLRVKLQRLGKLRLKGQAATVLVLDHNSCDGGVHVRRAVTTT